MTGANAPMAGDYDHAYYERQVRGALRSARRVVPILRDLLRPASVVDFGCGQGAWLRAWMESGVTDVLGMDGPYTDVDRLQVLASYFQSADLSKPVRLPRRFDVAQSLEVAEHLPEASADGFITSLVAAAPLIVFSAAVRGQGGAWHVNEQPLEYWRRKFAAHGYLPFDVVRPRLRALNEVEPWYRYNTVLYAHRDAVSSLPADVTSAAVPDGTPLSEGGSLPWMARRAVVSLLPRPVVDSIARVLDKASAGRS